MWYVFRDGSDNQLVGKTHARGQKLASLIDRFSRSCDRQCVAGEAVRSDCCQNGNSGRALSGILDMGMLPTGRSSTIDLAGLCLDLPQGNVYIYGWYCKVGFYDAHAAQIVTDTHFGRLPFLWARISTGRRHTWRTQRLRRPMRLSCGPMAIQSLALREPDPSSTL